MPGAGTHTNANKPILNLSVYFFIAPKRLPMTHWQAVIAGMCFMLLIPRLAPGLGTLLRCNRTSELEYALCVCVGGVAGSAASTSHGSPGSLDDIDEDVDRPSPSRAAAALAAALALSLSLSRLGRSHPESRVLT